MAAHDEEGTADPRPPDKSIESPGQNAREVRDRTGSHERQRRESKSATSRESSSAQDDSDASERAIAARSLVLKLMQRLEVAQREGQPIAGLPTGFGDLDEVTGGLQDSELIVVGARPTMGKSTFVLNIAANAAVQSGAAVAIISFELGSDALLQRMLTAEARVDANQLRKGRLREDEYPRVAKAAGLLAAAPLWISELRPTLRTVSRAIRAAVRDEGVRLVILDGAHLLETGGRRSPYRPEEMAIIARRLKHLALLLRVPILTTIPVSSRVEQRVERRPDLYQLGEGAAFADIADTVLFVYRQEVYDGPTDKDGNSIEGRAEIIIGKQRNGPTGIVNLYFHKAYTRFENYTARRVTT